MLRRLQDEHAAWEIRNFKGRAPWHSILGVMEELGELAHAVLKHEQGIRGVTDAKLKAMTEDAVGDLVIFLAGFCTKAGIDLQSAVEKTWDKVRRRNWVDYPETGMPPEEESHGS